MNNKNKMRKWIADNWKQIWGHGLKIGEERIDDFYVTVPVKLIMEEFDMTFDEVRGRI